MRVSVIVPPVIIVMAEVVTATVFVHLSLSLSVYLSVIVFLHVSLSLSLFVTCSADGHGTLTYPNGDYYTGEWRDGCKHGKGEFHYMDGSSYVGDWVDDQVRQPPRRYLPLVHPEQPSGWGKLVWRNGVVYEGSWLEGKVPLPA